MSRNVLFIFSVLLAAAVHGGFYVAAPSIRLLEQSAATQELISTFNVDLHIEPDVTRSQKPALDPAAMTARYTSMEDLLERVEETISTPESLLTKPVEIPALTERVASDEIARDYDLDRDDRILRNIDAKIIEIAQNVARKNIEIARRLVRPSSDRIVQKGEFPVLRGEGTDGLSGVIGFSPVDSKPASPTASQEPPTAPNLDAFEPERPAFEEGILSPEILEPALPDLPIERIVAQDPIQVAIRKESPYEFIDDLVDIQLDTYRAPGESLGYFRARISPKQNGAIEVLPKDVTFVVDASRSIMQRKLNLTARGIRRCIAMLRPEDRFNIVVFRDSSTTFRSNLVYATQAEKAAARKFLEKVQSRGETDVFNALRPVLETPPREGLPNLVIVASDGRPTTGVLDGREIINALTRTNRYRNSVYAFGGGNTVNRYLLDLLAYRNKGESHIVRRMDDIDEELPRFFSRLRDPILVALEADYGRIDTNGVYPKELPDFYRGRAVTIYGRYDPVRDKEFVMRLQGHAGSKRKELIFKADLRAASTGDGAIAQNWAFEKSYYIIGEMARVGDTPQLLRELDALSKKYGVRTTYSQ